MKRQLRDQKRKNPGGVQRKGVRPMRNAANIGSEVNPLITINTVAWRIKLKIYI